MEIFDEKKIGELKQDKSFYLDVSQDEKFILIGNMDSLLLCTTSKLFPDIYDKP